MIRAPIRAFDGFLQYKRKAISVENPKKFSMETFSQSPVLAVHLKRPIHIFCRKEILPTANMRE
jgi:hypothetical protein